MSIISKLFRNIPIDNQLASVYQSCETVLMLSYIFVAWGVLQTKIEPEGIKLRVNIQLLGRKARGSSRIHAATAGAWRPGVGHEREMRNQLCGWLTVTGLALAFAALSSDAECQTPNLTSQAAQVEHSNGKSLFETACAVCHGLDGAGGEHAPTIGRGSAAKSKSDSELARILRDGLPDKGMPPFNSLGNLNLESILDYLRSLQAKNEIRSDAGDPVHGQQIFFGKGGCANCHAMHGKGLFLSTDLSDFAYDHNANDIRVAIANPQEQQVPPQTLARVMTNSGQQFAGVIRNESNSSLQMQDTDGRFYLFMKSDLRSVQRSPSPSMPGDYQQKLSASEIEDLVSYIVRQSPQATDAQSTGYKPKNPLE
ncbi:MAG: c-type cytochrome [Terriglobales bacterium]|jgi:cytochrome c oxidase cbb3-type subunit III